MIFEHKEARSGKECPLLIKTSFAVDLKAYVAKEGFGRGSKLVFTTDPALQTMSKCVKHMAHNPRTADRYYDRSRQEDARVDVWSKINSIYQDGNQPAPDIGPQSPACPAPSDNDSDVIGVSISQPSPVKKPRR
ncbi:uncharacterized protein LOC117321082 isoform X1 [Pecten maximus]|uniref:uncharacterized protein LOC117321081 isoform X1 n=1 Tax=Pecten maximus TaxID=6579 RepID=UPI0014586B2A|nr:uncharacterized protein LOC117321081 isoform X1 [Pecten maximus]XP_033731453.1 uncharacterized protein LOC117321081 isoform X1 [Pecten maximus]XP_033731455.1 uncharacterized protein LOC117321082 isoform X1 [Pecten maximus]XP_033731456.1 uncharacterized protein LOC117321082 isoform X1 [Pecten maximus]